MPIDVYEPSVVAALKLGFTQPGTYYAALRDFGGRDAVFFDRYLDGHVVVGYEECQEIYRQPSEFGRGRLALPSDLLAGNARAGSGYRLMQAMSIFQDAAGTYALRRQRLLGVVGRANRAGLVERSVRALAAEHAARMVSGSSIDLWGASLRPFTVQCANLAILGANANVPVEVVTDAQKVAFFFDGKRPQRHHVLAAMEAVDRLGHWFAGQHGISRVNDLEAVADIVLLYVAAQESLAYLLYTCLTHLPSEEVASVAGSGSQLSLLVAEAARYDAPIQMSGRVAADDVMLGEYPIRKGQKVYLHVGAANHDDRVFDQPEEFVQGRQPVHLGFGWGPTRCVGSEYASACAVEYLTAFLSQFSGLSYDAAETKFDHGLSGRGLKSAMFSLNKRQ